MSYFKTITEVTRMQKYSLSMAIIAPDPLSSMSAISPLDFRVPLVGNGLYNSMYCSPCNIWRKTLNNGVNTLHFEEAMFLIKW